MGEYTAVEAVSPCQENTTALCWWTAKSRGTSVAQGQPNLFHTVLWLLTSDRKSRPGQPSVPLSERTHVTAAAGNGHGGGGEVRLYKLVLRASLGIR